LGLGVRVRARLRARVRVRVGLGLGRGLGLAVCTACTYVPARHQPSEYMHGTNQVSTELLT
jgi:hypothetical protein